MSVSSFVSSTISEDHGIEHVYDLGSREEEAIMESKSVQARGEADLNQELPTYYHDNYSENAEKAVKFYLKLIYEINEHRCPPTLFGFEYDPKMFTALKGYIISAASVIGYFGYKAYATQ